MESDGNYLTGLWFDRQKYFPDNAAVSGVEGKFEIFADVKRWLDEYFSGQEPNFTPPIRLVGTGFQVRVWEILSKIPYGEVTTYGKIAKKLEEMGGGRVSAQSVGGAVGHNRIAIIVPCHRVVGADGSLVGYAAGIDKKISLLRLEGAMGVKGV